MKRILSILPLALVLAVSESALGTVFPILGFDPPGRLNDTVPVSSIINSITVFDGSANGQIHTAIQGPVDVQIAGPGLNSSRMTNYVNPPPSGAADTYKFLLGLDAGLAILGLGSASTTPETKIAAWFASPIVGDGDTDTSEIFVVDWGLSLDNFQVQLLTSDATAGIAGAVSAKTVQVLVADQIKTSTALRTTASGTDQPLAGVGIDLDSEVSTGTQILGLLFPRDDGLGSGGLTGLDLTMVAAVGAPPLADVYDFNGNGVVDAADYVLWRNGDPAADGNHDTFVNQADYDIWKAHFGQNVPGSSASLSVVPEPMSLVLLIVGSAAMGMIVSTRQRQR